MIFITRSLIFFFLIIAISSPHSMKERQIPGDASLLILQDNSSSFDLFDKNIAEELKSKLEGDIPVEMRSIAYGEYSAIGDGILSNIQGDDNVLVVTDGNNNEGKLLGDMISFASGLNSTINTVSMAAKKSDVAVTMEGPSQVILNTEEFFNIKVNNVGDSIFYHIQVSIDGVVFIDEDGEGTQAFTIKKAFSDEGYHRIIAKIIQVQEEDYFSQNNVFYKTVKVVRRPRILVVSEKESPLINALNDIYNVVRKREIPSDLRGYPAMVVDDYSASKLNPKIDILSDYVADGNGIVVFGGENSYDLGNYKGSLIETLLPVRTGVAEEGKKSDINVVLAVDVSGTTGMVYENGVLVKRGYDRIIRAHALSVLDSIDNTSGVGAVVIGAYTPPHVGVVSTIFPLGDIKDDLIRKISRLKGGGQTFIKEGINAAYKYLLRDVAGSKNIILLSDGRGIYERGKLEVLDTVLSMSSKGIKTYVVGVGATSEQDQNFLYDISKAGGGNYFPADASNRLKVIFGKATTEKGKEYFNKLIILESTHFITYNVSLDAVVSGYNLVIPKPAARTLVTTNKNIPILVVWRYGLGRIASVATDDGAKWAGELLSQKNSRVITKTINWVIGDLDRNKDFDVNIMDTAINKPTMVNVVSNEIPSSDDLSFSKIGVNLYTATYYPEEPGFHEILGAIVAINYNDEYMNLGINKEFTGLVEMSGGSVFDPDDVENIVKTIKRNSKRIKVQSVEYRWIFALAALLLFLFEILIRRVTENRNIFK